MVVYNSFFFQTRRVRERAWRSFRGLESWGMPHPSPGLLDFRFSHHRAQSRQQSPAKTKSPRTMVPILAVGRVLAGEMSKNGEWSDD